MTPSLVERYLRLGLQVGRHVDGIVDAYYGPPELAAAVDAEPPPDPRALVAGADALLGEVEDGWLGDQVAGLRTYAGVLAGESRSYADEVEGCYGVRPVHTDEAVFQEAHARLEDLLPGHGSHRRAVRTLAGGGTRARRPDRAPGSGGDRASPRVVTTAGRAAAGRGGRAGDRARRAVAGVLLLPRGLRSRISVNVDLPISALELLALALHETYPGHHAERSCKEKLLVRGRGLLEETLVLVPTPQSLVSEGIASLAPRVLLEGEGGSALAALIHDAGIEFDLAHALAVDQALEPCRWAYMNAALLLHDAGAGEAAAQAYLQRWGLTTPELASHLIRFFNEPTSRSYVITYLAGRELCRSYVGDDPHRFRRLLTEQVRVGDLREAGLAGR